MGAGRDTRETNQLKLITPVRLHLLHLVRCASFLCDLTCRERRAAPRPATVFPVAFSLRVVGRDIMKTVAQQMFRTCNKLFSR